jgi:hypothetical protein
MIEDEIVAGMTEDELDSLSEAIDKAIDRWALENDEDPPPNDALAYAFGLMSRKRWPPIECPAMPTRH